MTGQEQELPVVRKLLRKRLSYEHCYDGELVHANPDGPEAAELITELVGVLDALCDGSDDDIDVRIENARAALTKARASGGEQ